MQYEHVSLTTKPHTMYNNKIPVKLSPECNDSRTAVIFEICVFDRLKGLEIAPSFMYSNSKYFNARHVRKLPEN